MVGIRAKYIGAGEFHHGIPARDLTDEDWARLDEEQRRTVEASRLYQVQPEQPPAEGGRS